MQPGQTITPGSPSGNTDPPKQEVAIDIQQAVTVGQPRPEISPQTPPPALSIPMQKASATPIEQHAESSPYAPTFDQGEQPAQSSATSAESLSWTASEFIEHQKPSGWYATVFVATAVVSLALYFLVRDVVTVVVVAVAAIMFAIVGARKPRALSYVISQSGLQIGDKLFTFEDFKSFSVIEEGAIDSIHLIPLKRLVPPLTLYFPPEQEDQIVDTLSAYLPYEERKHDPIDRLMKRVRF